MENQGIRYYAFTSSRNIIRHIIPDQRKLAHRALIIREKIIGMYKERGITGDRLALVAAITLVRKVCSTRSRNLVSLRPGNAHYGSIWATCCNSEFVCFQSAFLSEAKIQHPQDINNNPVSMVICVCYRAHTKCAEGNTYVSFLQAGNLMKRQVNGINSVLASAFVLILIKPSVIFDAGFLLSYSAVIFIISFYQDFYLKLQFKNWLTDKIWQSAVVTIVAQAGTLPLTIMLFNRFPTYFILTNILIVPLSSLLIIIGCIIQ